MTDDVRDDPRLENLPPTPDQGLSDEEAQQRRAQGMGNDAAIRTGRSYFEILRDNALNPVNLLLVGISIILAVLGLYGDAAVTVVLVVVNVVVGVYQEARAKQTLDRLSILTRPTATILRSGTERVTDQREAVLGDLMIVRLGDQLMLDGRVVSGAMEVDESLLTGEADRIPKHAGDEVLSGSVCVSGSATYRATRVGAESFANRLTSAARAFREDATPLQRDVSRVMRAMSILVAIAAVPVTIGIWMTFGGARSGRHGARRRGAHRARAAGPGGDDHRHLRVGHRPPGRRQGAHPALQRGRVDEPRGCAVPRQDRHADDPVDRAGSRPGLRRRGGSSERAR